MSCPTNTEGKDRTTRTVVRAAGTGLGAVVIYVAVPVVLMLTVRSPLPSSIRAAASARGIVDLLALVVWVAWISEVVRIAGAVLARVRRRDLVTAPRGLRDRIAFQIATLVIVLWSFSITSAATAFATPPVATTSPAPAATTVSTAPLSTAAPPPTTVPIAPVTMTVVAGDNLSTIALRRLGSESLWPEIATLNEGKVMDDGRVFNDPSMIYPGWVLVLPNPDTNIDSAPMVTVPPAPAVAPVVTPPRPSVPTEGGEHARPSSETQSAHPVPVPGGGMPLLPELAALGLPATVAALLVRSLVRRRRLARMERLPGEVSATPSAAAAHAELLLAPFAATLAADWLESALRHLTFAAETGNQSIPRIRLVRVGPSGVDLHLLTPEMGAPGRFESNHDGSVWTLPPSTDLDALPGAATADAWLPEIVPVGDDAMGTYFVPVGPSEVLSVTGPGAEATVATMRIAAKASPWPESVEVTDSPAEATATAGLVGAGLDSVERTRVLFIGPPSTLPPETAARVGVITTDGGASTDLVVEATPDEVVLRPMDLHLRPCKLDPDEVQGIEALIAESGQPPGPAPQLAASGNHAPGVYEIKVLRACPTIEGPIILPPDGRITRAVEMLALVALAGGMGRDRLVERLLGPTGSPRTVTNIASIARRMLGSDPTGEPYLNTASAATHRYVLSAGVTTDAQRLEALVGAATQAMATAEIAKDETTRTAARDEAIGHFRAGLELIEGSPLADVTYYDWWSADGFDTWVRTLTVDAACGLAPLAVTTGDQRLAQETIEKARLVDPYNETLYRIAIECAAVAGNAGWAHRMWTQCCEMVDSLAPGSLPSVATEQAYRTAMNLSGPTGGISPAT